MSRKITMFDKVFLGGFGGINFFWALTASLYLATIGLHNPDPIVPVEMPLRMAVFMAVLGTIFFGWTIYLAKGFIRSYRNLLRKDYIVLSGDK